MNKSSKVIAIVNGHKFYKETNKKIPESNKSIWRCTRTYRSCKARFWMINGKMANAQLYHNHDSGEYILKKNVCYKI